MLELLLVLLMLVGLIVTAPPVGVSLACATVCGLLVGLLAPTVCDIYRTWLDCSGVLRATTVANGGDGRDARRMRAVAGRMRRL